MNTETGNRRGLFDRIVRQGGISFAGKAIFFVLGFLINIILARHLGTKGFGQYQLGIVAIHLVGIVSIFGFDKGFTRYLPMLQARDPESGASLVIQGSVISLLISCALGATLYWLAPIIANEYYNSPEMVNILRLFSWYLPIHTLVRLGVGTSIGLKRADVSTAILNLATPILFLSMIVGAAALSFGIDGIVLARQASHAISAALLVGFVCYSFRNSTISVFDFSQLKGFLGFSAPLLLIGAIYFLLGQMDIIMLGYFVEEEQVGIYSVGVRLSSLVVFGLEVGMPVLGPFFSHFATTNDLAAVRELYRHATRIIFYLGFAVYVAIVVFKTELLEVFGKEFAMGAIVLLILGFSQLMNALSGPTGQLLVMTGKQKWEMVNSVLIVILNFVLNIVLIPRFGLAGAAIATGASIVAINLIKLIEVYYLYRVMPYNASYLFGIAATVLAAVPAYLIRESIAPYAFNVFANLIICGSAYGVCLILAFWLFGLRQEDKQFLKQIRTKQKHTI